MNAPRDHKFTAAANRSPDWIRWEGHDAADMRWRFYVHDRRVELETEYVSASIPREVFDRFVDWYIGAEKEEEQT